MSDMKTTENDGDVRAFLASVENARRKADAETVLEMMQRVTGLEPRMWGDSIIGFGRYEYARRDGSRHAFFRTGLSPRKAALTVYIMPGVKKYAEITKDLGKFKNSVSCLYVTRLENVDPEVLERLIAQGFNDMNSMYPDGQ